MNLYGFVYSIGFLLFYIKLQKSKITFKDKYFFLTVLISLIFARIYHVLSEINYYLSNISEIFKIWHGGLAFYGGVFGFITANLIYFLTIKENHKKEFINLIKFLNDFSIYLPLLIFFGRIANFLNHENNGVFIIPQQIFEAIFQGFVVFLLLLFIKRDRFFWFVLLYSVTRFITEFWRFYLGFKLTHLFIALILILNLGLWIFYRKLIEEPN